MGHLEGSNLPPAGTCTYLVHATDVEVFGVPGSDRYRMWKTCVDFSHPNASTLNQNSGAILRLRILQSLLVIS